MTSPSVFLQGFQQQGESLILTMIPTLCGQMYVYYGHELPGIKHLKAELLSEGGQWSNLFMGVGFRAGGAGCEINRHVVMVPRRRPGL